MNVILRRFTRFFLAVMTAVSCAHAQADVRWSLSGASVTVDTPEVQASLVAPDTPRGSAGGKLDGTSLTATAILPLPRGAGIGERPQLEASLSWLGADDRYALGNPGGNFALMPVDGSGTSVNTAGVTALQFDTELTVLELNLMVRESLYRGSHTAWSAYGGLVLTDYQLDHAFNGTGTATQLSDELDAGYTGVGLGTDVVYAFNPTLFAVVGLRVDGLRARMELNAEQLLPGSIHRASDRLSEWAARGSASAGLILRRDALSIGLLFSRTELSASPTVVHPLYDAAPLPSQLGSTSVSGYGANIGLGLSF